LEAVPRLAATLVVVSPEDRQFEDHVPHFTGWVARCGGATRAESVLNGLQALRMHGAIDTDWVLVHDAARCLLRPLWVDRLIDACAADPVGGLLALPLADTLKQEQADGRVAGTLPRSGKWAAQTPQMFRLGALQRALQHAAAAGAEITDEASAIECQGLAPKLVPGELENLKVTWPADFALARRLLETR
jgi:2-C-methyl-D-erythritol 4-phosphate cytidylyltransferase